MTIEISVCSNIIKSANINYKTARCDNNVDVLFTGYNIMKLEKAKRFFLEKRQLIYILVKFDITSRRASQRTFVSVSH